MAFFFATKPISLVKTKITVTIITLNEEDSIGDCIQSAWQIADEIIVIDSQSADNTRAIAQNLGAKVHQNPFHGYGSQKNVATQQASNDWIFNLDADERLDDQLVETIKQLDFNNLETAYAFPRKNYIGNRWQKTWSPDFVIRLYNKRYSSFSQDIVHESVIAKRYAKLPGSIIHYSFKDLSDCLQRADKYSVLDAKRLFEADRTVRPWEPAWHYLTSFFKFYVLKKGVFYGADGLTASLIGALRSYLKYAHLLEMRQNADSTLKNHS